MKQLAEGVAALHTAQKVHRDIKPSNIMVTRAGRVVLLDFGLATDADRPDRLDSGVTVVGTAPYMAPEQARSLAVGPEADWYAVGAVLYEVLTGRPPFQGQPVEILMRKQTYEPPPRRTLAPDAPRDLDALSAELRTLRVLGLPRDDARRLATRLLGRDIAELDALIDEAAGHPMFLHELVRHLGEGRRDVRLDDAPWARIALIDPAARRLLEVVAVAPPPRGSGRG